jgi:ADP-ribose pyrophosphatase YjhB (NUDIX family)
MWTGGVRVIIPDIRSASVGETGGAFGERGGAPNETGGAFGESAGTPNETGGAFGERGGALNETGEAFGESAGAPNETGGAFGERGGAPNETGEAFGESAGTRGGELRILLVRQCHGGKDIWMAPGGAIEEGESSRDAAMREVLEETGLIIHVGRLLWHVEEVSETRGQRFVNFFLGEIISGRPELGADPELGDDQVLSELRFFSKEELSGIEHIYPDYLRGEVWDELTIEAGKDSYRIRG